MKISFKLDLKIYVKEVFFNLARRINRGWCLNTADRLGEGPGGSVVCDAGRKYFVAIRP